MKKTKPIATPKSIVETILDKLPSEIRTQLFGSGAIAVRRRAALVADGEEALRVLRAKRASLMAKGDTPRVRAALVIDYLARNAPGDGASGDGYSRTTLPVPSLAKALGLQKRQDVKKLETMQVVIASYLGATSIGRQGGRKEGGKFQKKRKVDSLRPDAAEGSSSTAKPAISPTNLVRDLCIKLGSMIPDAEFATIYSMKMFGMLANMEGMERQANNSKRRFSRHELRRDLERHQEYYEAACFYLAVKKSEGESSYLKATNKKDAPERGRNSAMPTDGADSADDTEGEDYGDGEDERQLSEMDVVRAANLMEGTLRTVLDYVRDWTEGMSISLGISPGRGGSHSGRQGDTATKALFEVAKGEDGGCGLLTTDPMENAFKLWKRKVLQDAKASATRKMKEGDENWLAVAADDILRKASEMS